MSEKTCLKPIHYNLKWYFICLRNSYFNYLTYSIKPIAKALSDADYTAAIFMFMDIYWRLFLNWCFSIPWFWFVHFKMQYILPPLQIQLAITAASYDKRRLFWLHKIRISFEYDQKAVFQDDQYHLYHLTFLAKVNKHYQDSYTPGN